MTDAAPRDCRHGSLARSCERCDLEVEVAALLAEVERLRGVVRATASRSCLCAPPHHRHGGPCCGVAGGLCVTCAARALLDEEHTDG